MAITAAREAPPPADGEGARDGARREMCSCLSTRTRSASACCNCAMSAWRPSPSASYSYVNPAHEQRIKEILLEELPDTYLSVSHEVLPLYREFERFSTVCLNVVRRSQGREIRVRFGQALRGGGFQREIG